MARVAAALLAVGVTAGALGVAQAQDYPNRPIRYIVTTAPGGLMDVPARLLSDSLDRMLGQRVLVENRGGAGGNVGMDIMLKSPPDGYTLAQIQVGNVAINPFIYKDLSYDVFTDIVPVAPLTSSPILVVVNAGLAAKDLGQLVALAKAEPGKLDYGSAGGVNRPARRCELVSRAATVTTALSAYS